MSAAAASAETAASSRPTHPALKSRLGKVFIPSLSDLFFISLTAWLFIAGDGWKQLLLDGDTGWHIRVGDYILTHHRVPTTDLFSFSKAGAPWFAWEWLTDIVYAGLFRIFGLKGVVLLAGLMIAGSFCVLLRHMLWRGANTFVALLCTLLSIGAASIHFHARPHVVTLLLLATALWILERDRAEPSWHVWLLAPLTILWTNLHGGFLALFACLGLLVSGSAAEVWMSGVRRWIEPLRYGGVLAACCAASLVNPYGYQLHVHIAEYLRSDFIRDVVVEFQSPSFRSESMLQFEILLFAGLVTAGFLAWRRRFVHALWILYFAHMSLGSVRHVPLYAVVVSPLIAVQISEWWAVWSLTSRRNSAVAILDQISSDLRAGFSRTTFWVAAFVLTLVVVKAPLNWPADFPESKFPVGLVDRHAALIQSSRVFTTDQWADYLIYRFYPRQRVFVDGRSDFYGPSLGREYLAAVQGEYRWKSILDKYRIDLVIAPSEWPLATLLQQSAEWRLLSDTGKQLLLERKSRF
ncbi:MAG TPA: hypothetical protein VMZ52_07440 [Bryobacteraceae bacterium]|nr:hypothetical protein [Bryobacteraceae bacterium]